MAHQGLLVSGPDVDKDPELPETFALAWERAIRARLAMIVVAVALDAAVVAKPTVRRKRWQRRQI